MTDTPEPDLTLPSGVLEALVKMFRGPSRREQVQAQLLELELAERLLRGRATMFAACDFDDLAGERADWVVLGPRGSGKTAFAVALAQRAAALQALRGVWGVGWRPDALAAVGFQAATMAQARDLTDAVVVLDEFRVLSTRPGDVWELLSLARQRNVSVLLTAQAASAITPDVFRLGPSIAWKGADLVAAAFDRPELSQLVAQAHSILQQLRPKVGAAIFSGGQWLAADCPLPRGWSDDVSRLWR